MTMRSVRAAVALTVCLGQGPAWAKQPLRSEEFGYSLASVGLNLFYVPAKCLLAMGGLFLGSFTGLATGGSTRAAYGVWVPATSGTYVITPAHLDGSEPIKFFGTDYADRPSAAGRGTEGTGIYDLGYSSRPEKVPQ